MKVWWVLAWDQYYPARALGNVKATFSTKEEAEAAAAVLAESGIWDYVEVENICYRLT